MTYPTNHITKRFLAAASIALAVPLSALAFGNKAETPSEKNFGHCEGHGGMMHARHHAGDLPMHSLKRLNLSDEQQDKIFKLMHEQMPAQRDKMKSVEKLEQSLSDLKQANDYSDSKARSLVDQIAKARADMEMDRITTERKVLEILTLEQRQQLSEMRNKQSSQTKPVPGKALEKQEEKRS